MKVSKFTAPHFESFEKRKQYCDLCRFLTTLIKKITVHLKMFNGSD